MKRRLLFSFVLFYFPCIVFGQELHPRLSQQKAQLLVDSLKDANAPELQLRYCLKLADYQISKTGEFKSDLDSADSYLKQAISINDRLRVKGIEGYIYMLKAIMMREGGRKAEGLININRSIKLLEPSDIGSHLGDAYSELSQYYDYDLDSEVFVKIKAVEKSVSAYEKEKKILLLAAQQEFLADLYMNMELFSKAIKVANLSLKNYQTNNFKETQGLYIILASTYYLLLDNQRALNYAFLALKTADDVGDKGLQLARIYNLLGLVNNHIRNFPLSLEYHIKAFQVLRLNHNYTSATDLAMNIVTGYCILGKPYLALKFLKSNKLKELKTNNPFYQFAVSICYGTVYCKLKQYDLAKPHIEFMLNALKTDKNSYNRFKPKIQVITGYLIGTKQYGKAREYLAENMKGIHKTDFDFDVRIGIMSQMSYKLDSASGNYRSAINHLLSFISNAEKVYEENNLKQYNRLNFHFQTEMKEDSIKIQGQYIKILNQKNEIQKTKIEKANLGGLLSIIVAFILLIILGALYNQYKIKRKFDNNIALKTKQLQHLLTEKEWLLKEVHHRVKNNMHTVMCLLESQANNLENDALKAIESTQHRIYAMSLIHQKLYQSEDLKSIDMSNYIKEFTSYLNDCFGNEKTVRFQLDIEPLHLGISLTIPLALIINEAVTNSFKYAFNNSSGGSITINMHHHKDIVILEIADNGIGIDLDITNKYPESLGMKLMNGLSEDINASICVENLRGTKITVKFNKDTFDESGDLLANVYKNQY